MIPYGKHHLDEDDIAAVIKVLRSGYLTQGPAVECFESKVARYVGANYAVAVSSGTSALHLACLAAGVGEGDRVITSPNTFVASANCAQYVGAIADFVDIDPDTLNIHPGKLEEMCASNSDVKAIIPVHFGGLPCDMEKIQSIAKENSCVVIEDACHALGATYPEGGKVGNCALSDMTVFSFHPVKNIAAGEGGMVTTNSEALYRKLIRLRSHGINKGSDPFSRPESASENGLQNPWYYEMQELGYNFRITDIQSALGCSQMDKIDVFVERRRALATRYDQAFDSIDHIEPMQVHGRLNSAHHLYVVKVDFERIGLSRAQFMGALKERGIGTQVHYIPVPCQPYYLEKGYSISDYPNAEDYYQRALSIPLYFGLSEPEQQQVIDSISELIT